MVIDLDSLVESLPAKQEEKRLQDLDRRRQYIIGRFPNDPVISNTSDPRKLNSVQQCMYIIRCLENGLDRLQINDLFFGDHFTVETMINVMGISKVASSQSTTH